jgi:hypothetical protein
MTDTMRQYAPYPTVLAKLVKNLRYRPGWSFELKTIERDPADTHGGAAGGLTFVGITGSWEWTELDGSRHYVGAEDAYHPGTPRPVYFYFPVPAATYDEQSWRRWLFERILDVERHEAMEHFQIGEEGDFVLPNGERVMEVVHRPYSPTHGPGRTPYVVFEVTTDENKRTSFRGEVSLDRV